VKHAAATDLQIDSAMTLNQAGVGCDLRIEGVEGPCCERLRAMGFCEHLQVRKLAGGRNLLCSLCGTRVALSKELADHVRVSQAV
jgi:ferrous iron transport protein A